MGKLCRITVVAYMHQVEGPFDGYGRDDLENAIEYCEALVDEGFTEEPMDHFNLHGFIKWANMEIMRTF